MTPPLQRAKEPLDESQREEWKSWLKTQHQKTKIMASGSTTSWQIDGEQWKQWQTLFFWAPKSLQMVSTAMKLKDAYSLKEKLMTNLDSILKSRDITLPTKVHLVKALVFPVIMYGCESWTIKKAEHQVIDAFEVWCWRRLLRVPWTARRSNQSNLKEKNKKPPDAKNWLVWKDPDAGNDWRREEKGTTEDEMVGWHHRLKGHAFE